MALLRIYMCGGLRQQNSLKKIVIGMNGQQLLQSDSLKTFISVDPRLYFNRLYFLWLCLSCLNNLGMEALPEKLPEKPEMKLTLLFFRCMSLYNFIIQTKLSHSHCHPPQRVSHISCYEFASDCTSPKFCKLT